MYAPSADKPAVTTTTSHVLEQGHYARKQLFSKNALVKWSHRRRFELARELAAAGAGGALLDYGCGDGTFITLARALFRETTGTDIDVEQLADCGRRLGAAPDVRFASVAELRATRYTGYYDAVVCMEVLEHCVDAERVRVLGELGRLAAANGRIIVSVPIEVGPALLGKQFFRAIAAWRGHGDYRYRETYTPGELAAAAFERPNLARAVYTVDTPSGPFTYCGHKGFNWRTLEREIRERFTVERRLFTPLGPLGPVLNSQVWFVCRHLSDLARPLDPSPLLKE